MKVIVAVALCTLAVVAAHPNVEGSADADAALKELDTAVESIVSAFAAQRKLVNDQIQATLDHTNDVSVQQLQKWTDDLSQLRQKAQEAGLNVDSCLTEADLKHWSYRVAFAMNLETYRCLSDDFYYMIFRLQDYEDVALRAKTTLPDVKHMASYTRAKSVVEYVQDTIAYLNTQSGEKAKWVNEYLSKASDKLAYCQGRGIVNQQQAYDEERNGLEVCITSLTRV